MKEKHYVEKDPDSTIDYYVKWGEWLDSSPNDIKLSDSKWEVEPSGELEVVEHQISDTETKVVVRGGNLTTGTYKLKNSIETTGNPPLKYDYTIIVKMVQK